jgi:hypothetical protein
MICTTCGKVNIDDAAFCEQCGARMQAQPAVNPGVAMPGPGTAAPGPAPAPPFPFPGPPAAPPPGVSTGQMSALIAAMSLGEKISGAGAVAAVVSFFMPWFSVAGTQTSLSGLDFGKSIGAVYLILLNAIAAATLCYLSSKAPASRKLLFAGYLVLIGAICGPANLLALIFVPQVQTGSGIGFWLLSLGFCAVAEGGLMTIRNFSKRTY